MAIEAIVGKLNKEALGKAVAKSESMAKPQTEGSSFKDMLTKMENGQEFADMVGIGENNVDPTIQMQTINGDDIAFKAGQEDVTLGEPRTQEKIVDMLGEVNKGQMQMDTLVNHIMYSGKKFSNQELLVIQAHVFHFAQMTELTVKVAEQSVSSVKSVLNTQVQ